MILICGANGLLGRAICEKLPAEQTIAVLRQIPTDSFFSEQNIAVETADLLDIESCHLLLQKTQPKLLITAVGGKNEQGIRSDKIANINLIQAVENHSPNTKVILVTSVGCGEQWEQISPMAQQALGEALAAKTEAENYLQQTELNWLIIRPGGLNNEEEQNNFRIVKVLPKERKMYVSRKSVATAIVNLINEGKNHNIYSVISQE